jgi:hypothetical protein
VKVSHVGGRVDQPQGSIQVKGIALVRGGQPLGNHDLKNIPGPNVVFGLLDGLAKFGLGAITL